jgi:hypothetical protein
MRDTIEMAQEAQISDTTIEFYKEELKALVALARADERERIADESKHIIKRAEARGAAVEREACAKVADYYATGMERNYSEIIADAIRARGETK